MRAFDRVAERDERLDVRIVGAMAAGVIALTIAGIGALLVPGSGWVLGVAGLPGTTWLAWRMAPRAIRGGIGEAARVAVELGVLSILIADALVAAVLLGWSALTTAATTHGASDVAAGVGALIQFASSFVALVLIGAFMFGIPAAIVVLPAAFAWTAVLRRLVGARE